MAKERGMRKKQAEKAAAEYFAWCQGVRASLATLRAGDSEGFQEMAKVLVKNAKRSRKRLSRSALPGG
jgi:hypothetical protein